MLSHVCHCTAAAAGLGCVENVQNALDRDANPIRAVVQLVVQLVERFVEHEEAEKSVTGREIGREEQRVAGDVEVAAKVLYGTGQERRQAAQEGAQQAATIMVNWTPDLASVVAKDRVSFDGFAWDITSPPARVGLNDELHFTAVRSA